MKATDVIRELLNVIDAVDTNLNNEPLTIAVKEPDEQIQTGVDTNRFKHIFAMLDKECGVDHMYSNSPNVVVAPLDAVTKDAGGGWNGPKNPKDMMSNSIRLYPE